MITGNLNVISDARIRSIISKGPNYTFPSNIEFKFPKCRRDITASLNYLVIVGSKGKMLNLMP